MTTKARAFLYVMVILICASILLVLDSSFNRRDEEQRKPTSEHIARPTKSLRVRGY
jgi:hypothetical protein